MGRSRAVAKSNKSSSKGNYIKRTQSCEVRGPNMRIAVKNTVTRTASKVRETTSHIVQTYAGKKNCRGTKVTHLDVKERSTKNNKQKALKW